ncbi:MAG: Crp/Fnr family transcriptional regulator [Terracidiphilus sp.]|jgi:CRP/FNR family transcriptional regulator
MESMREGNCRSQAKRPGEFFSKLPSAALEDFSLMERPSSYAANVLLFTEGEPVRALFVILEGEVRLSINSSDGKRLSLRIARQGDIIGLSSALSGTPYDMTAETLYPSKIAPIERREFLNFLTRHPDAYQSVTEELGRQMSLACSQLRTLGLSSSAPEKLARLLLEWSDRGQAKESESRLRFSLTHDEIANFIGTSRETVTRTLSNFKNRHLVAFQGCMMTIPNRAALADYAHAQA